jgi:hypothetical protein
MRLVCSHWCAKGGGHGRDSRTEDIDGGDSEARSCSHQWCAKGGGHGRDSRTEDIDGGDSEARSKVTTLNVER